MKRLGGALVALAPLAIVCWSLLDASRLAGGRLALLGHGLVAVGAVVSALNFYLSMLRAPLARLLTGHLPHRHISGFPLVGGLAWIGLAFAPPSTVLSCLTLLLILCDTGGVSWFVVATWRDRGLWQ